MSIITLPAFGLFPIFYLQKTQELKRFPCVLFPERGVKMQTTHGDVCAVGGLYDVCAISTKQLRCPTLFR